MWLVAGLVGLCRGGLGWGCGVGSDVQGDFEGSSFTGAPVVDAGFEVDIGVGQVDLGVGGDAGLLNEGVNRRVRFMPSVASAEFTALPLRSRGQQADLDVSAARALRSPIELHVLPSNHEVDAVARGGSGEIAAFFPGALGVAGGWGTAGTMRTP